MVDCGYETYIRELTFLSSYLWPNAGLAAWSATRESAHVVLLLQTIYQAFDEIAISYGVFKVESIGESYVAVTGLPNPQPNHATSMARFAFACQKKMKELIPQLEHCFGTSTADLAMRFGVHSGPVTASILRGYSAQFRLCGDTVNVARKMEK